MKQKRGGMYDGNYRGHQADKVSMLMGKIFSDRGRYYDKERSSIFSFTEYVFKLGKLGMTDSTKASLPCNEPAPPLVYSSMDLNRRASIMLFIHA